MVERHSAFGAFPSLGNSHPFVEQDEDREEGGHVTFESNGPFTSNTNSSTVFFNSGEESSWSEGLIEEKQNEEVEYVEELVTESDDDKLEDNLGLKGVESYEEDTDHLASVCTDDGSIAEGPLLWRMDPKNRFVF